MSSKETNKKKIMKMEHYKQSVDKWQNIVNLIKKAITKRDLEEINVYGPCGFCNEFRIKEATWENRSCKPCPLYPKSCSFAPVEYKAMEKQALFWQIVHAQKFDDKTLMLKLSEQMLEKIVMFPMPIFMLKQKKEVY